MKAGLQALMAELKTEPVHTWFDLGLFLDRFRDAYETRRTPFPGSLTDFKKSLSRGLGVVTFTYGIDGVTMEIVKYAQAFERIFPDLSVHLISGWINEMGRGILHPDYIVHTIPGLDGFGHWDLYDDFFGKKLERGSPVYNRLIEQFWAQVLDRTQQLGQIIEQEDLGLLFLVNSNSNPGNVALALASVLVSLGMDIPVINNNHDFYWEGGSSKLARRADDTKPGPRDHFFTNRHLGEVFTLIECLFPWNARSWLSVNINRSQSEQLVTTYGLNPANVAEVCTSVDTEKYNTLSKRRTIIAFQQVGSILGNNPHAVKTVSVHDLLEDATISGKTLRPMLVGHEAGLKVDFASNNLVLLQPTRIIERKRIGHNFKLLKGLMEDAEFLAYFQKHPGLDLTLIITGPIASGHFDYFKRQLRRFAKLVQEAHEGLKNRVFLGFLFSGLDKQAFKAAHENPIGMPDLYNMASVVVLPSETEGRGLPIVEAAACGRPVFTRRYDPQNVFAEVVGEHLDEKMRLKVLDFEGWELSSALVQEVKRYILYPQDYQAHAEHNRDVIMARYSVDAMKRNMEELIKKLYLQLSSGPMEQELAVKHLASFRARLAKKTKGLEELLDTRNRQYLPGYGQMGFMNMLKALVDPSYFRVEEQLQRAWIFSFANELLESLKEAPRLEDKHKFLNAVEELFLHFEGEMPVKMDHSMSYRHRHNRDYPYRYFTPQEMTGVVNTIFNEVFAPPASQVLEPRVAHHQVDWDLAVAQLCGTSEIVIDHRDELFNRLHQNIPIALFPGRALKHELELLVLQLIRARLQLPIEEELTQVHLDQASDLASIYIFQHQEPLGPFVTAGTLTQYLEKTQSDELKLLFDRGLCKVVPTEQVSVGIDFRQLGREALAALIQVKKGGGVLIAVNEHAAMTTDFADIERFHIGRVTRALCSHIMGIPQGSGYIQWVPAGLRFCLAYPVPTQTGKSFSDTLKSDLALRVIRKIGKPRLMELLREDASERGSPLVDVLRRLDQPRREGGEAVSHEAVKGVYGDGLPWAGVMARVHSKSALKFKMLTASQGTQMVSDMVQSFNHKSAIKAKLAWNGGYILNPELVGKLGLPESYISSPLGLLVSEGEVLCPPLFNKPAFLIFEDGHQAIKRVQGEDGLMTKAKGYSFCFEMRNPVEPPEGPCYYDLMFAEDHLPSRDRVLVRMAGRRIIDVIKPSTDPVPMLPVGLTLSFPKEQFPENWAPGTKLTLSYDFLEGVTQAVEAGPMLLHHGKVCIDMEVEGWKRKNSINTQAARLDYLDMRGPKIAVGLDKEGNLGVLAVNGRIRESVGASHVDMADILKKQGMVDAMGFDPGGSATLVVGEEAVNISPYNSRYLEKIYALPPESRPVANAVVGY